VDPGSDNYQGYESVEPTSPPGGPLALNVGIIGITDREHEAKCTWIDTADNEEGFRVQRKVAPGSYATIATLPPDTELYIDTSLSGDTTYTFRVLAYNALGSASSVEVSWSTAPVAPDGLYVSSWGASDFWIDWNDNSATRDEYRIEHCTDGVSWVEVAVVSAPPLNTYRLAGLSAGTHYARVRAYSAATGYSNYSNVINHTL
jgi:titin